MNSAPEPSKTRRVLILTGGESAEHTIAAASGRSVAAASAAAGHQVHTAVACRGGGWRLLPDGPLALEASFDPDDTTGARDPFGLLTQIGPDVVFPALHGPRGEDGTIQGLLELAGFPYVGSGVLASALCMDKGVAKEFLAGHGVQQVAFRRITSQHSSTEMAAAVEGLGLPLFVKPANMGSSIGVRRVDRATELDDAVAMAREHDSDVVVEAMSVGREVSCSIIGASDGTGYRTATLAETRPTHTYLDFHDKYGPGSASAQIPAPLEAATAEAVRTCAVDVARRLCIDGLARVDLFVEPGDRVLVNEINTMPGFTEHSSFPRMWAASGLDLPALVDELYRLACTRFANRRRRTTR